MTKFTLPALLALLLTINQGCGQCTPNEPDTEGGSSIPVAVVPFTHGFQNDKQGWVTNDLGNLLVERTNDQGAGEFAGALKVSSPEGSPNSSHMVYREIDPQSQCCPGGVILDFYINVDNVDPNSPDPIVFEYVLNSVVLYRVEFIGQGSGWKVNGESLTCPSIPCATSGWIHVNLVTDVGGLLQFTWGGQYMSFANPTTGGDSAADYPVKTGFVFKAGSGIASGSFMIDELQTTEFNGW